MLQKYFLDLHESNKTPYRLINDAQIEPGGAEDPDELYRMQLRRPDGPSAVFDVIFFPDRAEIQGKKMGVRIGEIKKTEVENAVDVAKKLRSLKTKIVESSRR
jgi:hypothetical protein